MAWPIDFSDLRASAITVGPAPLKKAPMAPKRMAWAIVSSKPGTREAR